MFCSVSQIDNMALRTVNCLSLVVPIGAYRLEPTVRTVFDRAIILNALKDRPKAIVYSIEDFSIDSEAYKTFAHLHGKWNPAAVPLYEQHTNGDAFVRFVGPWH